MIYSNFIRIFQHLNHHPNRPWHVVFLTNMKSSGQIIISHSRTIQQLVWSSQHHQGPSRVGYIAMLSYDSWWVKKISQATYPSLSEALILWGWALVGNGHLLPNAWYSPSTSPIVCPNFWSFFFVLDWGGKLTRPSWRMVCWCFQMDLDVALLRLPRSSRPSHLSYHADDASLHGGRGRAADERLGAHLAKLGWIILPTKIALLLECRWHWQYHFSEWLKCLQFFQMLGFQEKLLKI